MKRMFFMAALALMCMISCKKNEMSIEQPVNGEKVLLNVSVPTVATKAVDVDDKTEDAVNNLQVFVFRKDGSLDAYASEDNTKSLVLSTTAGVKDIVAVTNAPAISDVTSLSALNDRVTYLQDNAPGSFIMTGNGEFEVTAENASVDIDVTRRIARIYLTSVSNNFSSEAYRSEEFRIEKIYMVNAAGSTGYFKELQAETLYNEGKLDAAQPNENLKSLLQDETVGKVLDYGETAYTEPHYFYCYPNAGTVETEKTEGGPKCTKLVIETTLAGKTYYYPVAIGNILANHKYKVTVDITRPGSEDPDTPVSFHDATVTVNVVPWAGEINTDVTI